MWVISDDLRRVLAEVSNLRFKRYSFSFLSDLIKVDTVLIGKWIKDIHMLNCILSSLFIAVYEIDPVVD